MESNPRRQQLSATGDLLSPKRHPLVSVIIIFYNPGVFLEDAILSVREQTYENWELLLVDDGATDGSSRIARQYAAQDPRRVRYLEHAGHSNRGMSASRNLGVRAATGDHVALLDADDVWLPETLQEQVDLLERHADVAAVCGMVQCWYSWTGEPADAPRDFVIGPRWRDTVVDAPELLLRSLDDSRETPTGLMIRRRAFTEIGGFEEVFRGLYEDQVFCAKLCLHAPIYVSGRCWYRYRHHRASACAQASPQDSSAARGRFLDWLDDYVEQSSRHKARIASAIATERARLVRSVGQVDKRGKRVTRRVRRRLARALPAFAKNWLRARWGQASPAVGSVRLGDLRRTRPMSSMWGFDRGRPIDRYYIEGFLEAHAADIRGVVLEMLNARYTRRFGADRVKQSEVLSLFPGPEVTLVGDLTEGAGLPSGAFDCVILTQTLPFIYDLSRAMQTLYRVLKPGGVLLATVPGISHISRGDMERSGDYWRFTSASVYKLFAEVFPARYTSVDTHGNVLAATAFLHGLASEELDVRELGTRDPDYEMIVTVRAVKPNVRVTETIVPSRVPGLAVETAT